jgi:hypothetical protein
LAFQAFSRRQSVFGAQKIRRQFWFCCRRKAIAAIISPRTSSRFSRRARRLPKSCLMAPELASVDARLRDWWPTETRFCRGASRVAQSRLLRAKRQETFGGIRPKYCLSTKPTQWKTVAKAMLSRSPKSARFLSPIGKLFWARCRLMRKLRTSVAPIRGPTNGCLKCRVPSAAPSRRCRGLWPGHGE